MLYGGAVFENIQPTSGVSRFQSQGLTLYTTNPRSKVCTVCIFLYEGCIVHVYVSCVCAFACLRVCIFVLFVFAYLRVCMCTCMRVERGGGGGGG